MAKLLSGLLERASSTLNSCSWNERQTPTKRMSTLELKLRRNLAAWPSSTLVVFRLTSPKTASRTLTTSQRRRTAPFTCVQCLTPSNICRLSPVTLAQSTGYVVIRSTTKSTVPSSSPVLMIGRSEFGVQKKLNVNLPVIRSSRSSTKSMTLIGHQIHHPYSRVLQMMEE